MIKKLKNMFTKTMKRVFRMKSRKTRKVRRGGYVYF